MLLATLKRQYLLPGTKSKRLKQLNQLLMDMQSLKRELPLVAIEILFASQSNFESATLFPMSTQERIAGEQPRRRLGPHGFDIPQSSFAPGVRGSVSQHDNSSPFLQVRIVTGEKFMHKASRSWSFTPADGPRGDRRRQRV